jgi:glycosyltransferase involved in cell wall biosynthesis
MHILEFKVNYKPEIAAGIELDGNTAEDLAIHGHHIELYVPKPSRGISKDVIKATPKEETLFDGNLCIHRYHMYHEGKNIYLRLIRFCFCCVKQLWLGLRQKDIDLVFAGSTPPFQGIICRWIKKIKKVPFLYNCQDIFPDSLISAELASEGSLISRFSEYLSKKVYQSADKIIVIADDMRDTLISKGVSGEKIEIVYNWIDEKVIYPVDKYNNKLISELGIPKYDFTVVYAGNLGYVQGIEVILDAAERLKCDSRIGFVIFGNGALEDKVKETIVNKRLNNVKLYPLQPYDRVSEVYSIGDACIVSCKKGAGGFAMPSKTWSIMGCGRPVLASFDRGGAFERMIADNRCGLFSDAGDVESLSQNILSLCENMSLCKELGNNAREYILNHLTRKVGTGRICQIVDSIQQQKGIY